MLVWVYNDFVMAENCLSFIFSFHIILIWFISSTTHTYDITPSSGSFYGIILFLYYAAINLLKYETENLHMRVRSVLFLENGSWFDEDIADDFINKKISRNYFWSRIECNSTSKSTFSRKIFWVCITWTW